MVQPNPFHHQLTIDWQNTSHEPTELLIYNLQGQLVKEEMVNNPQDTMLDVSSLDAGLYIIRIRDKQKWLASERIVKIE